MGPKKKDKKAKAEEAAVEESGFHSDGLIIRVKTHSKFFFFRIWYHGFGNVTGGKNYTIFLYCNIISKSVWLGGTNASAAIGKEHVGSKLRATWTGIFIIKILIYAWNCIILN